MRYLIAVALLALSSLSCFAASAQANRTHATTGAKTWETQTEGVHFSLTQLLPDQVRAFYVNRGFTLDQIEPFAQSCVYMAVLRNDSAPGVIHYALTHWSVTANNREHTLTPATQWIERLSNTGAKKPSTIAFRWAQLPPEQEYRPGGDWNQGMLSIGLPAATVFDITAQWDITGKGYAARLTGVECANE